MLMMLRIASKLVRHFFLVSRQILPFFSHLRQATIITLILTRDGGTWNVTAGCTHLSQSSGATVVRRIV